MFSIKITKKQKKFPKLFNSIKLKDNFMNGDFYTLCHALKQQIEIAKIIIYLQVRN